MPATAFGSLWSRTRCARQPGQLPHASLDVDPLGGGSPGIGYHLTILRTADGKQLPISLEEARSAAAAIGTWTYSDSPPSFELVSSGGTCTLWHQDGELWAKTPDAWALEPMLELARQLDARVRGDEGETYRSVDSTHSHPDDAILGREAAASTDRLIASQLREERLIRYGIWAFFAVLGVVGYLVGSAFE